MYKLAADRRPKVARPKVSFAQNQTEADDLHATFKPIKINYSYFNYTGGDITIVDRSNMKFTIRPVASGGTRFGHGIMVVKNYVFHDTVIIDEITLSNELSQDQQMLRKAFANRRRISPNESAVDIVYTLSPEAFREFDECVYISELDIVITRNANDKVVHPYSESGLVLSNHPETMKDFTSGIGFKWVTHKYLKETFYLNLCGAVIAVSSIQDLHMEEGFYVYTKGMDEESATRLVRMSLDEAVDKYGLTRSLYDAQTALSAEARIAQDVDFLKGEQKKEILEREHQVKLAQADTTEKSLMAKLEEMARKQELDRETHQTEMDKRTREHEQFIMKLKLDVEKSTREMEVFREKLRREEESNRRKDYYEDVSYKRKDSSELIKWLPGIIIGAGLLLPKLSS